jgi:hypothetical protein
MDREITRAGIDQAMVSAKIAIWVRPAYPERQRLSIFCRTSTFEDYPFSIELIPLPFESVTCSPK